MKVDLDPQEERRVRAQVRARAKLKREATMASDVKVIVTGEDEGWR